MRKLRYETLRAEGVQDSLTIEISRDVTLYLQPHGDDILSGKDWNAVMKASYALEARRLCILLQRHIPGGLFDALLGAMLEAKASLFIVPHDETLMENKERQ